MAGSLNGSFGKLSTGKLEVLSLLINNACNLRCKHCYLEAPNSRPHLKSEEWIAFLSSLFSRLRPSVVSFAGKEPLLNQKSTNLIFEAVRLRDRIQPGDNKTQIGVITNGTLVHKYAAELLATPPDYFDISIDGLPGTHDEVRGPGAFEQLRPNLVWLAECFPERLWITHTLLEPNITMFPQFVEFYHRTFGLRKFSVGFYKPLRHTAQELGLRTEHYYGFVEDSLERLAEMELDKPVEVIVEMDHTQGDLIEMFTSAGWIQSQEPISSDVHRFGNGLTLRINKTSIPVGLWRAVRVTPEGYWLAAEDLIRVKEYEQLAVANLRDHAFDAVRLYEVGLNSQRYRDLMEVSERLRVA